MITKTPSELTATISTQKEFIIKNQKQISDLNIKINCLDDSIVRMTENCNQRTIDREKIYAKKMLEQQKYVNDAIDEINRIMSSKNANLRMETPQYYKIEGDSNVEMLNKAYIHEEYNENVDSIIKIKLKDIKKVLNTK